jgi:hypothetical protein
MQSELEFEWDGRKASQKQRKHGVSFEEARTAFLDENGRLVIRIISARKADKSERRQYAEFLP